MNFKNLFKRDKGAIKKLAVDEYVASVFEHDNVTIQNEPIGCESENVVGIQGVKSRESLVMQEDPFGAAPFSLPVKSRDKTHKRLHSAASTLRRTADIPEPVIEEKLENVPAYDYSSESRSILHVYSEGDVPLIGTTETESDIEISLPKKVQLPLELPLEDHRHKYEKLVQGLDVSSDSSEREEHLKSLEKTKRKKKINIPEKLHHVYKTVELPIKNFRSEDKQAKIKKKVAIQNPSNAASRPVDIDSDDSIGSASDLKADDDIEIGQEAKEDLKSENISEDIQTCGSSAYHAECESMATREEDCTSRVIRAKKKEDIKVAEIKQSEDLLFIGHQYGERPLLADDELDSDNEAPENAKWDPDKNIKKETLWIPPSSSFDDPSDVFSLAPFGKTRNRRTIPEPKGLYPELKQTENPISESTTATSEAAKSLNPFLADDFCESNYDSNFMNIEVITSQKNFEFQFNINPSEEFQENVFVPPVPDQSTGLLIDLSNTTVDNFPVLDPTSMFSDLPEKLAESPKVKQKKEKKKDKEMKSKYQLFSDNVSDESSSYKKSPKNVKTSGSSSKKSNKSKKGSSKILLEEGFSNMSFEDFPSDEREIITNSELPFEVLRTPDQENRRANNKKMPNPFS